MPFSFTLTVGRTRGRTFVSAQPLNADVPIVVIREFVNELVEPLRGAYLTNTRIPPGSLPK